MGKEILSIGVAWLSGMLAPSHAAEPVPSHAPADAACRDLAQNKDIKSSQWHDAGPIAVGGQPFAPAHSIDVPAHCEVIGSLQPRTGADGQHYAIRFHLRLPATWNERFLFQGGGGSNGDLGEALGSYSPAASPALMQGYAVVTQDAGHDNQSNNDTAHGGVLAFGFDPIARANYGGASLPLVTDAAKALIKTFYGAPALRSYFIGCSKGGEEGLSLAEHSPQQFDGIAVGAPAMSLPRAAVAEAWNVQAFATAVDPHRAAHESMEVGRLAAVFSAADLTLVRSAVLDVCDADDGIKDGLISDFALCTSARVKPALEKLRCKTSCHGQCLTPAQLQALYTVMGGAKDSRGHALYTAWPWDAGIGLTGWNIWQFGVSGTPMLSLNVILGGPSLASVFTTPPTALGTGPQSAFDYLLRFDFDRDAARIYATDAQFPHSAWVDISARSSNLQPFRAHGGRLIVYHGVSDPVFSINDTIAWWREVDRDAGGHGADFVRLFPVPGMNHCAGGNATDQFDVLQPLRHWVEEGIAPDQIIATAGRDSPWAQRTRPLCPYPKMSHYRAHGDSERAESFECVKR